MPVSIDGYVYNEGMGEGTTGFAKAFTDAMKAGQSYDTAIKTATQVTGGSGITANDMVKMATGALHNVGAYITNEKGYVQAAGSGSSGSRPVVSVGPQSRTYAQTAEGSQYNTGGVMGSVPFMPEDAGKVISPSVLPLSPSSVKVPGGGDFSNYLVFAGLVLLVIKVMSRGQGRR